MTSTRKRIVILFAAVATLAALLAPGPAQAKDKRELTVMTRNIYLGASLTPAVVADDLPGFVAALTTILGEFEVTKYGDRSGALANEILATQPDLIGLQEVAEWTIPGFEQPIDFLDILLAQLAGRGLEYEAVATSYNADIFVDLGGFPQVRFRDRDVILKNNRTEGLQIRSSESGNYAAQFVLPGTPIGDISFNRGWTLVDGTFEGKKFRFVNTHLETEDFATVQEAQTAEFLAGPAKTGGAVIAVGDFNSAADGSTTASYDMLTKSYFDDAWDLNPGDPGLTCCQNSSLSNGTSELNSRIDLVLTHAAARALSAEVVGDIPFRNPQTMPPPFWPSDHAGVVAVVRIH